MNLFKTVVALDREYKNLMLRIFSTILLVLTFISCVPPLPKEPFRKEEPAFLREREEIFPLTDDGDKKSLLAAINNSLFFLEKKLSGASPFPILPEPFGGLFTPERASRTLRLFKEIYAQSADQPDFDSRVAEKFSFLGRPEEEKQPSFLLTGYYEPIFEGSREARAEYRYPIYCRPDDLVEIRNGDSSKGNGNRKIGRIEKGVFLPYYSRAEIDSRGVLEGKGYELAWLKDPWERFVLHIQGSGQIRLPGEKILRVGFANSNGRPYRSIGQYLVQLGYFPETDLSLRRVREFLREHPEKAEEILNQNERYIFFRPMPEEGGPYGSLGFPLTAGRSIAVDHSFYPQGAVAYLIAHQPVLNGGGKSVGKTSLRRFVLNQDTGAAMKGSGRIDFFCGTGEKAGLTAGEMREEGRIYFLLARE
jgi:membrane-bound lytic murein transglycosylase A